MSYSTPAYYSNAYHFAYESTNFLSLSSNSYKYHNDTVCNRMYKIRHELNVGVVDLLNIFERIYISLWQNLFFRIKISYMVFDLLLISKSQKIEENKYLPNNNHMHSHRLDAFPACESLTSLDIYNANCIVGISEFCKNYAWKFVHRYLNEQSSKWFHIWGLKPEIISIIPYYQSKPGYLPWTIYTKRSAVHVFWTCTNRKAWRWLTCWWYG